jgi:predicted transcriptional regulator
VPRRLSVTLSLEDARRLDRLAQAVRRSKSWLGHEAIRRLLDAHDAGQLELPL